MIKRRPNFNFKTLLTLAVTLLCVQLARGIEISSVPSTATTVTGGHVSASGRRIPKQVGLVGGAIINGKDNQPSGTHYDHGHHGHHHDHHGHNHGFTGGHHHDHGHHGHYGHGDGKYFQYAHNPHYDEYEFGYRRGNDYHFQERYEKYGPYWNFKTKVKWGDKHGGYGEHYWDYNHAGSSHDHDDGGHGSGDGHYSEPVPTYEAQSSDSKKSSLIAKRENREKLLKRRNDQMKGQLGQIASKGSLASSGRVDDNKASPTNRREYRQSQIQRPIMPSPMVPAAVQAQSHTIPSLVLDPESGHVIDETTGKTYWLKPTKPSVSKY